jgi:hypothetical protein
MDWPQSAESYLSRLAAIFGKRGFTRTTVASFFAPCGFSEADRWSVRTYMESPSESLTRRRDEQRDGCLCGGGSKSQTLRLSRGVRWALGSDVVLGGRVK